ncbi:MAG TPA: DUF3302 domain-containing protein [Gemmataceae bacterium]|nr:DUF3302 domain-containing protein [Gemmataceae bacterium]
MDGYDVFALFVMTILVAAAVAAFVLLGKLPGDIARKRGHPQAAAVTACGWLGVLTLGILWPLALIWAYWQPRGAALSSSDAGWRDQVAPLQARVEVLERKLDAQSIHEGAER